MQPRSTDALRSRWQALPRTARLLSFWAATRLWAWAFMVSGTFFVRKAPGSWPHLEGGLSYRQVPYRLWDVFGRWDTDFYLSIAHAGYPPLPPAPGWAYQAAYFPFLPALMRGLNVLTGIPLFYAGILIANVLLLLAVFYLDKLASQDLPPEGAELTVLCLLAYPGSHFLSCVYPESLALFLGVFAVYCARKNLLLPCALACAVGAITRSTGWIICLAVIYELCLRDDGRLRPRARALILLLPVATVAAYMALQYSLYHDPLYFVHVEAGWKRKPTFPLLTLFQSDLPFDYHLLAWGELALLWLGFRRRERPGYLAMGTTNVFLPLSSGILNGVHRYLGSNFPLFIILAKALRGQPRWKRVYFGLSLCALAFYSFRWGQGFHPN